MLQGESLSRGLDERAVIEATLEERVRFTSAEQVRKQVLLAKVERQAVFVYAWPARSGLIWHHLATLAETRIGLENIR